MGKKKNPNIRGTFAFTVFLSIKLTNYSQGKFNQRKLQDFIAY